MLGATMRRREFIKMVAGLTAGWPLVARAQQASMPLIGFMSNRSAREAGPFVAAFIEGLATAGYEPGRNVAIEYRWADGHYDHLPPLAKELAGLRLAAFVATGGTLSGLAAKAATSTVPVIFLTAEDPVQAGLVDSLNRPGGNVTGVSFFSAELGNKRRELLCELVPAAKTIALLVNQNNPLAPSSQQDVQHAVEALGRRLITLHAGTEAEIEASVATLAQQMPMALIVQNDAFFDSRRERFVALAAQHAIPAIYHIREFPAAGGLASYGASLLDSYRQIGAMTGKILQGENPRDFPVVRPTRFEFVINSKTAKALGLSIPPSVLAIADEVIE